jgi:phosphoribosylanthranilate isomerase
MTRVKICCISSIEEGQMAVQHGADALGLVGHMPSGPGVIEDSMISAIARRTPPPIATFLLTSETSPEQVIAHQQKVHTNTIQIVDALADEDYASIRAALPGVKLVQVIHVLDEQSLEDALAVAPEVDALLLDSGNPNAATKILGGTGNTHDWDISRKIVEQAGVPVFLAGGLNARNVKAAVEYVQPFGVDLCSGVRTEGKLAPYKLDAFFSALR